MSSVSVHCWCVQMLFVCEFWVKVNTNIFGFIFMGGMGSVLWFIYIASCVLYFAENGVKRVHVVCLHEVVDLCPCIYFMNVFFGRKNFSQIKIL